MFKHEKKQILHASRGLLFDQIMYNLTIDQPAEDMLEWLKSRDRQTHSRVVKALDELEQT
jgi:Mn-containing catalase